MSNRKLYEAVPVEPWKKKPSMKEVPGLDSNGDINMVTYFPEFGTFYFVETDKEIGTKTNNGSNIITHVLVAVEEVDKWISPEAVLDFIQNEHELPVPGVVASDESDDHTYKDRIILTDAGFYWESDDEGNWPMDSKDIIQMYKNSLPSASKQDNPQ